MTILFFGIAEEIVGSPSLSVSSEKVRSLKTVGHVRSFLLGKYPKLENLSSLAIAVNSTYAQDDLKINDSDEIALIPPVSGG
jgi:molybdopterin synthase sulfur carrier subunit